MSVVTGVFHTIEDVEGTVQALLDSGFTDDDIGVVVRDTQKGTVISDDLGREYASGATPRDTTVMSRTSVWDRLPEKYDEMMHREGLPADSMGWYQQHLDAGDVLLIVNSHDRNDDVMRIMRDHRGELYHGAMGTRPAPMTTQAGTEEMRLPVVDEEVTVEKTRHEVGEVHITSETTRESVEIPTVVTHEQVRVERRKLDHPLTPEEYKGRMVSQEEICMPIVEEEVRVTKRPVIREEMVITRVPVTEKQTMRETVTHTEPHVEKTGKVDMPGKPRKEDRAA